MKLPKEPWIDWGFHLWKMKKYLNNTLAPFIIQLVFGICLLVCLLSSFPFHLLLRLVTSDKWRDSFYGRGKTGVGNTIYITMISGGLLLPVWIMLSIMLVLYFYNHLSIRIGWN